MATYSWSPRRFTIPNRDIILLLLIFLPSKAGYCLRSMKGLEHIDMKYFLMLALIFYIHFIVYFPNLMDNRVRSLPLS